jgi:hypothetical protein
MMSEAAPQDEDIEQALGSLLLVFGDEFEIGHDEKGYWAYRHGEIGGLMRADTPVELGEKMTASSVSAS